MRKVRVLIADDSATMVRALTALLDEAPGIEVVGRAVDGIEAVNLARSLRPDVITMDVVMPRLDGLGAIAAIMADSPSRILVVASVGDGRQTDLSFKAMAQGAMELIAKPSGNEPGELRAFGARVVEAIRLMSEVPVVTRRRGNAPPAHLPPRTAGRVDAFGVVASTGGPPALAELLGLLPETLPIPVLIAQHIAPGFTAGLVRWLSEVTPLKVRVAVAGEACRPGFVYLPSDGLDLEIDPEGLLRASRNGGGHCPSGDRLLRSLALAYGERAGGMVLTGMGDDGARGLLEISRAGGATLAQDEASCAVFGMPQVARALGATSTLLPVPHLAMVMRELSERSTPRKGVPS
ncbi:MAG: chemotaxis protein CheB [Myxococcaceae bacterium]